MQTVLASFAPFEILIQGRPGDTQSGASPTLVSLLKAYTTSSQDPCGVETIPNPSLRPSPEASIGNNAFLVNRGNRGVRAVHVGLRYYVRLFKEKHVWYLLSLGAVWTLMLL
jgi:hypothetical protein